MEVVDSKEIICEDAVEMNSDVTEQTLSSSHILTPDVDKEPSASIESQVVAGCIEPNKGKCASMEKTCDESFTMDTHTNIVSDSCADSDIAKEANNMETTMIENKNSETLNVDTKTEIGMSAMNRESLAKREENLETSETENKNSESLNVDTQTKIGMSAMNGDREENLETSETENKISESLNVHTLNNKEMAPVSEENKANRIENLKTTDTENKNSEISTVDTLNGDYPAGGQNSMETTATEHKADVLLKMEKEYREQNSSDSDSDSSSSRSSSSSSSDEEEVIPSPKRATPVTEKATNKIPFEDLRTEGEICLDKLPPIEELSLDIEEGLEMVSVGTVSSVLGVLAIIQSAVGVPALNEDTILFTEGPKAFGRVFEVFGPVSTPWYSVRFNTKADIETKGIKSGMQVFYAPQKDDYTKYVFVSYLKNLKGSDASWKDDNEPPEKYKEYSDDDEERASKSKSRAKDRSKFKDETDANEGDRLPGAKIRKSSVRGTGRPQKHWKDTEQYGQSDQSQNSWNNGDESYNSRNGGPHTGYSNQQGRGAGPRYAGQTYSRGVARPQRFNYPRPRSQGPFGGPANFQSEPSYNMNRGPNQYSRDNNRMISPGRFCSPDSQMRHNLPVGNAPFGSNFTSGGNEWSNMDGYKQYQSPRQPITDNRLIMNQDNQIRNFTSPPPPSSYNQNGGFDINQQHFAPSPQSTQHISAFQSPPPSLNTNMNQFNGPPPFLPSSSNAKNNNSFIPNQSAPPPSIHNLPMGSQQMTRPPFPQHPTVFGGQPHFTQGPSGRQ